MKMTERYGSPGGGSVGGSGSNRKHKKHKTVVCNNSASSTLPTISTKSSSLNNNGNNFDDNFLTTESSFTMNGQQQQPSCSKSLCENVKSLKLVLKVGQSGSYSPASAPTITTSSFLNNSKTQIINNIENNNYDIDSINQSGDSSSTYHHDRSQIKIQSTPPPAPPELLPLNVDSYHHNVDFIPINNTLKKVKKKKKKHHHHHHHHSHGHNHSKSSTSTNNIDNNVTTIKTTTFMKLNNHHLVEIIKNSSDSSIHNNNNSGNSIDNIVNNSSSSSSSNNNDNNFVNMKNKNSQCSSTDVIYAFDNPQQQKPMIPIEESTSKTESINENLQSSSEGIECISDSSISVWPAVSNNNNNVNNELLDVNENDVVEDEDGIIMGSMLFKQDSIFSSVDLMDIDSCSKLDISALVPEGDELNDDISQQSSLMSQYQLNQRPRAKLRPTSSIYRQLLQKGQVRCDSNNIYEHLRGQEKMSNDSKTMEFSKPNPFQQFLKSLLNKLQSKDVYKLFAWPVIDSLTPGYSQFICHPMDFHTIQKKIEHNLYRSVAEMKYDVRILCENAISYYRRSGLHYKEASKLWYYAKTKVFARNQLAEHVKQFPPLTMADLGMDDLSKINSSSTNSAANIKSTTANGMETQSICNKSLSQQTTTLQALLSDSKCQPNNNKSVLLENGHRNDDDLLEPTAEQIFEDIKKSFIKSGLDSSNVDLSKLTLNLPQNDEVKLTRVKPDGTTTLPFVLPDNEQTTDEINLGHLVGRLLEGTPALEPYKEPIVNRIKPCRYIEEMLAHPFSSHLPYLDSGSSTIDHQDTALLFETFGKYQPSKHSDEIERVANDQSYLIKSFVDSLLVTVSKGDYKPDEIETCNGTKHDTDDETDLQTSINPIQKRLNETKDLLEQLEVIQKQRLCKTTEPIEPTTNETEVAGKVTTSLVDIIKSWFQPSDVIDQKTLHKHLGIEIKNENGIQHPPQSNQSSATETFSNFNNNL